MEAGGISLSSGSDGIGRKISYSYDPDVGTYYSGHGNARKPHLIRLTHSLFVAYGLYKEMEVVRPCHAGDRDLTKLHAFLSGIAPETVQDQAQALERFNVGGNCPAFNGLYRYCQTYASGSIGCAARLNFKLCDIARGHSHAKKCEASGFCYVNDIFLSILELLKYQKSVLYVDIDVHHGDGVEKAFYTTDRVTTVSLHKFGDYFPGSGHIQNIGYGKGKYYALNVPLNDGIDDENLKSIFKSILQQVMIVYDPEAVVLQCGANSLAGDRLGYFKLSVKGHAECILRYMRSFNVPRLLLGGGGFTIRNVAKCWCYESRVAVGKEIDEKICQHDCYEYYGPHYSNNVAPRIVENKNSKQTWDEVRSKVLENINKMLCAPSVQFQERPPDTDFPEPAEDDYDAGRRSSKWVGASPENGY
ncbi:hypothetical protein SUGI_0866990 [Cryptomeria japonica]|uniref:histone deacetylase 19 n=1 Tax=Cryptomeria japonica TaxID=3369 RepID=UPI002414B2D6|nr:histone deacetylase 19 [Cryptomeria japonica]GLJ41874.1 hypothetical protein SUGI_0866990 [Cryptomeria japonica]